MDTYTLVIIGAVVLVAIVFAFMYFNSKKHTQDLHNRYGAEYDLAMEKGGDKRSTEKELGAREKRINNLDIRDLNQTESSQYQSEWFNVQRDFIDDPAKAVGDANRLITEVMIARGFPVADFDQRAADVSVLFPDLVSNYRKANAVALKADDAATTTDERRLAMVEYRSLFHELLTPMEETVTEPVNEEIESEKVLEDVI